MQLSDFEQDGWCLESGEELHAESPKTFWIPDVQSRKNLKPGAIVKLIFRIEVDDKEELEATERMWVIVNMVSETTFSGILDNIPYCVPKNPAFKIGMVVRFLPEHIIDIDTMNAFSWVLMKLRLCKFWIQNSS